MYQVIYMMGFLAGKLTLETGSNGKIGLVGPVVIPETVRHVNAFTLGARRANPDVEIYLEWVGAWFDPPSETAKTNQLLQIADVEILMGFTDTVIPLETAGSATTSDGRPVLVIGYDNPDTCQKFATDRCLTSAYWNWAPLVNPLVQKMIDGTWDPGNVVWDQMRGSPEMSSAYFAPLNTTLVRTDIRVEVEELVPTLVENNEAARMLPFAPPPGGLVDTKGTVRLPSGEMFEDQDLLEMCWLLDGIKHADGTTATVPSSCPGVQ
jgi:basic membrane protein A